jgi:DNA-directed RNA polymerase subunit N (RpoN/RPB10)
MACPPILCYDCGEMLGELYEFVRIVKEQYYKEIQERERIHPEKLGLHPTAASPIGFILDSVGIKKRCCRMHMVGYTDFDTLHS